MMIHCQLSSSCQPTATAGLPLYCHGSAIPLRGWQPGSGGDKSAAVVAHLLGTVLIDKAALALQKAAA